MRFGKVNRTLVLVHAAVTLIAYAFLVAWLVHPKWALKALFITIWWSSVMVSVLMST